MVETGPDSSVVAQTDIAGPLLDGEQFSYGSVTSSGEIDPSQFPAVLQLNIFAQNESGDPIVNVFAIAFSNRCDVYPALEAGSTAGWVEFVSFQKWSASSSFDCLTDSLTPVLA